MRTGCAHHPLDCSARFVRLARLLIRPGCVAIFSVVALLLGPDAIGATVRIFHGGTSQSRLVKSGSSYLSQSELPVTFGVGRRDRVDRVVVQWPSGRTEEFPNIATGQAYDCTEGQGITPVRR